MASIFIQNYQNMKLFNVTGEVISSEKIAKTDVHISNHRVSVHSNDTHQIWLRTDQGQECSFTVHSIKVPLRVGQNITIISAERQNLPLAFRQNNIKPIFLINHNSKDSWYLTNIEKDRFLRPALKTPLISLLGFIVACIVIPFLWQISISLGMKLGWITAGYWIVISPILLIIELTIQKRYLNGLKDILNEQARLAS